jgi:hypothetical protein
MFTGFGVDCFVALGEVAIPNEISVVIDVVLDSFSSVALVCHTIRYYNYNFELILHNYRY